MDLTNIEHWAALVAILGTSGAAFLFLWKKSIMPFISWVKRITVVFEKVDFIASELKPNGGSSLRDAVDHLKNGLEMSIQRQRVLMMDSHIAIFESDANGEHVFVNNTYLNLIQRTFDEISGNGWVVSVHPDDREMVFQSWADAIEQNRLFECEYRYLTPSHEEIPVFCRATPMRSKNGKPIGWIGCVYPSKNYVKSVDS